MISVILDLVIPPSLSLSAPLFLKKWANFCLSFIYFRLFKNTFQILQQVGM